MMIDDDDVAFRGTAAHLGDEALVPRTAFLAQTGIGAGVQFMP